MGELFKLPDIGKHGAVVGAVVIDKGDGGCRFSRLGHGGISFLFDDEDTAHACSLYAATDRRAIVLEVKGELERTRPIPDAPSH
jgi:hypothetical protein